MGMMKYDIGRGGLENWIIQESGFSPEMQGKCESIFYQGNGYMGIRNATEESYIGQVRNCFVSGSFNQAAPNEVTELPNAADVIGMDIYVNGKRFNLHRGNVQNYARELNVKNGLVKRSFEWEGDDGVKLSFQFRRIVSMHDLHTIASDCSIRTLNGHASIVIKSGINGQVTNSGAQHFHEGEKRIFEGNYLQMLQKTTESDIDFVHNTTHTFNEEVNCQSRFEMDRRKVLMVYELELPSHEEMHLQKISNVFTSRDKNLQSSTLQEIRDESVRHLVDQANKGFDQLLKESTQAWNEYWDQMKITIEGQNPFDQLAIRFAQYHLMVMTPAHDDRMGVAAKGLSGEGYKGHSFWDTEIFILPFFTYTFPEIAKSLLIYRYHTLEGAHKKAKENGYKGAMYPWESAWADDGEVTPVWGAADIITGKATKIWSGFIEQHITSDIAFAVWQYFMITGDYQFMQECGYEILLDTGIFWGSRLEWNEEKKEYHINDIVGPDEYKEHVNNDAFTNHTAKWCIENAIYYYESISEIDKPTFDRLNEKLKLDREIEELREKVDLIYIPIPNEKNIIPQDDTYLTLREIDLTKYKSQSHVGSIFKDFNLEQVNQIQVSKQASVVMLMYLLEHRFSHEVKQANFSYYEPRTLHDSSLSLSTHAILANDLGNSDLAYSLFERASRIDLGPDMKTSDHGIHAASIGGIWQIVVCGFGGVRMKGGKLFLHPKLPQSIDKIEYPINWKGNRILISAQKEFFSVHNTGESHIEYLHKNDSFVLEPGKVQRHDLIREWTFD